MTAEDIDQRLEAVMAKLDSKTAEAIQSNLPLAGPLAAVACELASDLSSLRLDLIRSGPASAGVAVVPDSTLAVTPQAGQVQS
jgi:hypothetical protein